MVLKGVSGDIGINGLDIDVTEDVMSGPGSNDTKGVSNPVFNGMDTLLVRVVAKEVCECIGL